MNLSRGKSAPTSIEWIAFISLWLVLCLSVAIQAGEDSKQSDGRTRRRTFELHYEVTLDDVPPGRARVWIPVPQSSPHQVVEVLDTVCERPTKTGRDKKYGNEILYFESKHEAATDIRFSRKYKITRLEIVDGETKTAEATLQTEDARKFLSANTLVPIEGRPLKLIEGLPLSGDPFVKARALYDRVDEHVSYDKSDPGFGRGDSVWVCDSRTGNCTDFHSLFMTLARSQGIPAKFHIGFPLPPERGAGQIAGYHCWAMFHVPGRGWIPVDISEADKHPELKNYYFGGLTENRVLFSEGRDIPLMPSQSGPPLNYFVSPYVEVDGEPLARKQIKLRVAYSDKPGKPR